MSHSGEFLGENKESTMVRDVSSSPTDRTHLLQPAPPAIGTPMNNFPLESPPSSAKHFHHIDTQSKRMDRQAELEELRNKGLAKNLRKDLDQADAVLMTSDDFFHEQQQLQRKWKEQQQASMADLHRYRGHQVDAAQVTKKFQNSPQQHRHTTSGSTDAGLSEMDSFFHQQCKINKEWKKQQQDSMLYLHTYRGEAPVADEKPVVVSPTAVESKHACPGSGICNILERQVSPVEGMSIPLSESLILPRMDSRDDSDMLPALATDDCNWKQNVAALEVNTASTLLPILNTDTESMAVIVKDERPLVDDINREVVVIESVAAEGKTELLFRANDDKGIQVDATDVAEDEQSDQVDSANLPHVEGGMPSETECLPFTAINFSTTNTGKLVIIESAESTNKCRDAESGKWCGDGIREGENAVTAELLQHSIDIDEENDGLPVVRNDATCTGSTRIDKVSHDATDTVASTHVLADGASEIDHIGGITIPASSGAVIAADSNVTHKNPAPASSKLVALSSRKKPINLISKWSETSLVKPNYCAFSSVSKKSNPISRAPLVVKRTPTLICRPRSVSPRKVVPLYKRPLIQQSVTLDSPICNQKWIPCLHSSRAGCERCLYHASAEEKIKFETEGRHYLIFLTKGGCSDCTMFPRNRDEKPARLCRKCFFDTHRLGKR